MYPPTHSTKPTDPYFKTVRQAPLTILVAVVTSHVLLKYVFFSQFFLNRIALPVERASRGFITPSTLAGLISLILIVVAVGMLVGSLRPADLGFHKRGLTTALSTLLIVSVVVHVLAIGVVVLTGSTIQITSYPLEQLAFASVDSFVGAALSEECLYRGLLLVQVYFLIRDRTKLKDSTSLVLSIILTQSYFGVNHIASAIRMQLSAMEIVGYLFHAALVGSMLAVLFIRTRSILVPVVAHGLLNVPIMGVHVPVDPRLLVLVVVCLLMLVLPYIYCRDQQRFRLALVPYPNAPQTIGDATCDSVLQPTSSLLHSSQ